MAGPGALRLKGAAADSKVTKPKKKKAKPPKEKSETETELERENSTIEANASKDRNHDDEDTALRSARDASGGDDDNLKKEGEGEGEGDEEDTMGKTEAEIQHALRRRQRLQEKLKAQGTKTHKQRVEELNRYLSGLSEHHDMPRIGPG